MCLKTTNTAIYNEIDTLCGRIYLADSNKINKQPTSTSKFKNSERKLNTTRSPLAVIKYYWPLIKSMKILQKFRVY